MRGAAGRRPALLPALRRAAPARGRAAAGQVRERDGVREATRWIGDPARPAGEPIWIGDPVSPAGELTRRIGTTPPTPPGSSLAPPAIPGASSATPNNSLALIAGVGVLLLAMGVGVLIGRAGAGSAKAPPAQVITLGGAAGAGAATTPTTTTPEAPAVPTKKKGAKAKESSGAGSSITKPAPPSSAANLRSGGSGQSYEQRSKSLPNVVSTG